MFWILLGLLTAVAMFGLLWSLTWEADTPASVAATPSAALYRRRSAAFAVLIFFPLLSASLYAVLGAPRFATAPSAGGNELSRQSYDDLLVRVETRVAAQPDDLQGWVLLARSYTAQNRWADAKRAYEHVLRLSPPDAPWRASVVRTIDQLGRPPQ